MFRFTWSELIDSERRRLGRELTEGEISKYYDYMVLEFNKIHI